jgi:type II secretory pathway component PulF
LVNVLSGTKGLPRRAVAATLKGLQLGQPITEAFDALHPHLRYSDIALIQNAQNAGALDKGFALLANQYFLRSRTLNLLVTAFIYPIGIFAIGLFLMNLQSLLYEEASLKTAATGFITQLSLILIGCFLLKTLIAFRPPLLQILIRRIPPFRAISRAMAVQRFVWVLSRSSKAALPPQAAAIAAADASGNERLIRQAERFKRAIALGEAFPTAFARLLSPCPKWVRESLSIHSPHYIENWAQPVLAKANETLENATAWVQRLAKPVALIIMVPLIFLVMKNQWLAMIAELQENAGWFF